MSACPGRDRGGVRGLVPGLRLDGAPPFGGYSGLLAATSLLDGTDYAAQASREFDPSRNAGFVNRTMLEALPQWVFDAAIRFEAARPDLAGRLRRHWVPSRVKSLLAPRLLTRYADRLHYSDRACHETSCQCLGCICGDMTAERRFPSTPQ